LKGFQTWFIAVSVIACAFILWLFSRKQEKLCFAEKLSLCFILGGTFGNLLDRVRLGYVVDFIDFKVWPVFNVADSFITIGAALLCWGLVGQICTKKY